MTLVADSATAPHARADAGSRTAGGTAVSMDFAAAGAWDDLVADFDGVCQEQLLTFAATRWPDVRHEPAVFRAGGKVIGGCLVMIQRLPLGVGSIAVAKWGPMLADQSCQDATSLYAGMVERLIQEYAVNRRMTLSVLANASLSAGNLHYAHLVARGFHPGARLQFPDRYIVNLRLSDDEQRASLDQKWRYHLSKSEKAGLAFEHAGPKRRQEFDELYAIMVDRKRFSDYSAYRTVPALFDMANPLARPELFFVRYEGRVIAGAVIFKAGDRAVYLYGATTGEALPLRAGYFMHWNIIRWLRDNTRAGWYDLGGTDGFHGLHQFKKGMAGSAGIITPLPRVATFASYPLPLLIGRAAFAARDAVQGAQRFIDAHRPDRARPDQRPPAETRLDGLPDETDQ